MRSGSGFSWHEVARSSFDLVAKHGHLIACHKCTVMLYILKLEFYWIAKVYNNTLQCGKWGILLLCNQVYTIIYNITIVQEVIIVHVNFRE